MQEKPVVLLLAGGKSVRFWPLSEKNTYTFLGKNLVEHHIETLHRLGFHDLIIVSSEKVFDWLVENTPRFADFNVNYVKQREGIKGMAGAVLSALENFQTHFQGRSLYILNCNDIYDASLHEQILTALETRTDSEAIIAGYKVKSYQPLGYLRVEGDVVKEFVEKPTPDKVPSDIANLVVDLFRDPAVFFEALEKVVALDKTQDDLYEQALNEIIKDHKMTYVLYDDQWKILKYPWHVLSVMDYYLNTISEKKFEENVTIAENAVIGDKVYLSAGVRVMSGANIVGPCFIGKNTVIGNNVLIRNSIIGEDCVIGFGSEVARSYLGNNIWLHQNYVGDSILENNISFGAGTVTGNYRLDEEEISSIVQDQKIATGQTKLGVIIGKDVRVGINVSLMPGVKLGAGSFIGPGMVVSKDVAAESFIKIQQEQAITKNKVTISARMHKFN